MSDNEGVKEIKWHKYMLVRYAIILKKKEEKKNHESRLIDCTSHSKITPKWLATYIMAAPSGTHHRCIFNNKHSNS
jgi:hypothetical protein